MRVCTLSACPAALPSAPLPHYLQYLLHSLYLLHAVPHCLPSVTSLPWLCLMQLVAVLWGDGGAADLPHAPDRKGLVKVQTHRSLAGPGSWGWDSWLFSGCPWAEWTSSMYGRRRTAMLC